MVRVIKWINFSHISKPTWMTLNILSLNTSKQTKLNIILFRQHTCACMSACTWSNGEKDGWRTQNLRWQQSPLAGRHRVHEEMGNTNGCKSVTGNTLLAEQGGGALRCTMMSKQNKRWPCVANDESHHQELRFIEFSPLVEDKITSDYFPFTHFYDFTFLQLALHF